MRSRKWPYLLAPLAALVLLAAIALPAAAVVIPPPIIYYTGVWQGQTVNLTHVANQSVEDLPDAKVIGQVTDFRTDDSYYEALNGESINVFTAPSEFPGVYAVHNGLQGNQSVYGTWTFPAPTAKQNLNLSVSVSPGSFTAGQNPQTVTWSVTLSQPVSDGTIALSVTSPGGQTTQVESGSAPSGGGYSFTNDWVFSTAGTWTVNAAWTGDGRYNAASGTVTVAVNPAGQKQNLTLTLSAAPNPVGSGQYTYVTVNLSQPVSDGTVSVTGEGTTLTGTPQNGAWVSGGFGEVVAGSYTFNATWSGDARYNAASASVTVTVTGGPTKPYSVTLSASPASLPADGTATATVTATVTGANGQPVPDDSVDFTASAGTAPAAVQTNASGQATATYTAGTTPGSVNISGTEVIDSASGSTTVSLTAPGYTYTGTWDGQTVTLTRVTNVTVEGLPDETLLPAQLDNFQTNDPEYTALNGENINVFTAPTEFPGVDVVHNGLMGTQSVYGTWTFTPPSSVATVAALRIDVSSPRDFGRPFTFTVTAVDAGGNPVTTDNATVALTSSTNNVDFTSAATGPGQPVTVKLVNGTATVHAQDPVQETTTITATDAGQAGITGSAQMTVVMGIHPMLWTPGVDLSVNAGAPRRVADINFIDYKNGVNQNGCQGGFWPLGVGKTYTAAWTGTLWIPWPGTYRFRNTADDSATAAITVNGRTVAIPENSWTQGTNPPVTLQLQRGFYALAVNQQETDGQGGAGDTLEWQPFWRSSLVPVPAFYFRSGQIPPNILPASISFTIGSKQYVANGTSRTVDTAPFIQDGRTYLAVRDMGYAIGMSDSDITWNQNLKTATFAFEGHSVSFTLGRKFLKIDGVEEAMDVAPVDVNGRIFVPTRYFANAFGYQAHWDAQLQKVSLTPPSGTGDTITWGGPIGTNGKG